MRTVYGVVVHPVCEDKTCRDRNVDHGHRKEPETKATEIGWYDECWLNARSKPLFLLRLFGILASIIAAMFTVVTWVIPTLSMLEAFGLAGWYWIAYRRMSRSRCVSCRQLPEAHTLSGRGVSNVSPIPRPPPGQPPARSPRYRPRLHRRGECQACDNIRADRDRHLATTRTVDP
ncbi:hypothetical protein LCGC14_0455500 [marine sediment metagenome]|uniref:Uncharacterized protein n=1 Tax=marine sediment metagenome TaxID=412755 RepID=A0A0F9SLR9_9ZZZZ